MRSTLPSFQPIRIPTLTGPFHPPAPYLPLPDSIALLTTFLSTTKRTLILTGAGISVDSGIRAYRGKNGSYTVNKKHRPIFYGEFIASEPHRRRYWARSFLGYLSVQKAKPNPTHYAIASLQKMGLASGLITQNVDGLHHKAWDTTGEAYKSIGNTTPSGGKIAPILELHGTLRHAHCLSCGTEVQRDEFQARLSQLNPAWHKYTLEVDDGREERLNPDGDVELGPGVKYEEFNVPPCSSCGGPMKPKVTFFGESLSTEVRDRSLKMIEDADQLLVIGSSLATYSAFRLCRGMKEKEIDGQSVGKVGILNVGECRGDPLADWRIGWEGGAGDIVPKAVEELLKAETRTEIKEEVGKMLKMGVVKKVDGRHATS